MKALGTLIVIAALAVGGWYLYTRVLSSPEKRTCGRLAELCGEKKAEGCTEKMAELRKNAGDDAFKKAESCVAKAESCLGAAGCMVGAHLSGLGDFLQGVVDGLGGDLEKKGKELMDSLKKKLEGDKK
jgi:hypothetical protein